MAHAFDDGALHLVDRGARIDDLELWKIRPDGSELQQMTEGGGVYAAWSPDGSRIATSRLPPPQSQAGSAFVFDVNRPWTQQTPQMLPPFEPPNGFFVVNSWSPDGRWLAGQAGLGASGVVTYSFRSGRYERLTDFGEWPVWLPDSRRILFSDGGPSFWLMDTRSREMRKVYSSKRDVLGPPRLTRDGRAAYFSRRITESDIWLATLR